MTPDALGPYVTDNLCATRHIVKEYGKYAMGMRHVNLVSTLAPGVMGQTGMETVEVVRGVVKETKPDLVIAVDALAKKKQPEIKPYDPDRRYRNPSGFRSGESQKRDYQRIHRSSGDRDRSPYSCGCGNHCQ